MIVKMRLVALLLVPLVALGGGPGVVAQSTETEKVEVRVNRPPCAFDAAGVLPGTRDLFGSYEWDGVEWVRHAGGSPDITLGAQIMNGVNECDVSIAFGGLVGPEGNRIDPGNFRAFSDYSSAFEVSSGWTHRNVSTSFFTFTYTLVSIPSDLPGGLYTGVVEFSIVNSA